MVTDPEETTDPMVTAFAKYVRKVINEATKGEIMSTAECGN